MKKYILCLILASMLFSCSENHQERILNNQFTQQDSLKATKIPIKEILKPINILSLNDYIIIQNEYIANEDCFYVYKKGGDYDFLFSFGKLGQAAEEFIAPSIVNNNAGNELSILDNARNLIKKYAITNQSAEKIGEYKLDDIIYPLQEPSYVNDSILLYGIMNEQGNSLYSYNIRTKSIIDNISYESSFKKKLGNKYNSTLDGFNFTNKGKDFVVAFNFVNEIKTGTLNQDYSFNKQDVTPLSADDFTPYTEKLLYENYFYYMFPVMTNQYIYAIYMGRPMKQLQPFPINMGKRYFDAYIEVYDKQMNPVKRLKPDNDLMRICVDEHDKAFYAWNPLNDFDFLLKYDLK